MRKELISYILILSLFAGSGVVFANVDVENVQADTTVTTSETPDIVNNVKREKKNIFSFFKNRIKKAEDTKSVSNEVILEQQPSDTAVEMLKQEDADEISDVKKQAVEDANYSLFGEKYNLNQTSQEENPDLVEGTIKEEVSSDEVKTVEGYIHETLILSLDDCVKKALENNPQIRSAFSSSEVYKTKIGQAWSNYFPTFNLTSGYTRNRYFTVNFAVPQRMYNLYNAMNLTGSQLLFDFGKTKAIADVAKSTYESTIANLDETVNTVVYDVKEAYFALLHALEKQNVYEDSVKNYELQLQRAEAFYEIGTKPKIDVTIAQYNLGNAQLGLIKAINEVGLATARLNNAMGLPAEGDYKILDKLEMKEYNCDFDDILEKAYQSRPELISYKKKAQASELLVRSSKRAFLPDIEAVGNLQVGGGTKFNDDYGWTVGAQFVYGNTNLMLLKKQIDEAKATHQKDLADLETVEQRIYLEVKQAYIALKNATESIPVTALSLKHAKEQYDLASGRYRTGVGDAIELKDSEITYRNARLDYLAALLQYNISVADLERVVGFKLQEKTKENSNEIQQ